MIARRSTPSVDREVHLPRRPGLSGWLLIPPRHRQCSIGALGNQSILEIRLQTLVPQPVQHRECLKRSLRHTAFRDEAIAAIEWLFHHTLLFENVGEGPV